MRCRLAVCLIATLLCTVASSAATTPRVNESFKLRFSSDQGTSFGGSVAIDGDIVLVGSDRFGALRRFDRVTGVEDTTFYRELGPFESEMAFAVQGGVVAVASAESLGGFGGGRVELINLDSGITLRELTPDERPTSSRSARSSFGSAIAIDQGVVLVGDEGERSIFSGSGAAYLFDAESGEQLHKFQIEEPDTFQGRSYFGAAVALHDNIAYVAAPWDGNGTLGLSGSVRTFDVQTGIETQFLAHEPSAGERFGGSIDIDPATGLAVVGADRVLTIVDEPGAEGVRRRVGAAYVFDTSTGQEIAKLLASDSASRALFARSVAIDDGLVLVGAPGDDENGFFAGAAYLYDVDTGVELAKLLPSEPFPLDGYSSGGFGSSVAIDDGFAVIGTSDGYVFGSAYVFDLTRFIPEPTSALLTAIACLAACSRQANPGKPACVH